MDKGHGTRDKGQMTKDKGLLFHKSKKHVAKERPMGYINLNIPSIVNIVTIVTYRSNVTSNQPGHFEVVATSRKRCKYKQ